MDKIGEANDRVTETSEEAGDKRLWEDSGTGVGQTWGHGKFNVTTDRLENAWI